MDADIKVPPLGESVSSATVARWLKQPGEAVAADEPLVELETDKVTVEVNAPSAGTLGPIQAADGAEVQVGSVLGTVASGSATALAAKPASAKPAPAQAASAPAKQEEAVNRPAPQAQQGVHSPIPAPGPVSRPASVPEPAHAPFPSAAKIMQEQLVVAAAIGAGSGKDGRITKGDVIDFLARPAAPAPAAPAAVRAPRAPDAREERVKMTRLRRTIAARLKEAQNNAAMLTTFNEVDMSAAMALRSEYKDAFEKKHGGVRLGFMSFFVRACVAALGEFPAVNAQIDGDEIVY